MNPEAEMNHGHTQVQGEALEPATRPPKARPGSWYLLEIGSKAVHVLVIGQQGVGLTAIAVDIPDAQ